MYKSLLYFCFSLGLMFSTINWVSANPPSHETWDALLKKYVSTTGKVNYKGLKTDKTKLEDYLKTLSNNAPEESWSKGEQMASGSMPTMPSPSNSSSTTIL